MATSPVEQMRTLERLAAADTHRAVAELARLDRQTTGWGCIALVGLLGFGAATAIFIALALILGGWLTLVAQLIEGFLRQLDPPRSDQWLMAILLTGALVVLLSPRWQALMDNRALWQQGGDAKAAGYARRLAAIPTRLGMTLLAGSFLPFTLFGLAYSLIRWRSLSAAALDWLATALPAELAFVVAWLPYALLLLAPFFYFDWRRRTVRRQAIGLTVAVGGVLALAWLIEEFDVTTEFAGLVAGWLKPLEGVLSQGEGLRAELGQLVLLGAAMVWRGLYYVLTRSWAVSAAVYAALGLVYPSGLSYYLARVFYWPYTLFGDTLDFVGARTRLRRATAKTLAAQLRRNQQRIQGDGRGAVCPTHLQRFARNRQARSYFRSAVYFLCPVCQQDETIYCNVACVSVLLDEEMTNPAQQRSHTLYLNGLRWLDEQASAVQPPFESLVIDQVDHFDVEQFVIHCQHTPTLRRALRAAPCYLVRGHTLNDNALGILRDSVAQVHLDYELSDKAPPCPKSRR